MLSDVGPFKMLVKNVRMIHLKMSSDVGPLKMLVKNVNMCYIALAGHSRRPFRCFGGAAGSGRRSGFALLACLVLGAWVFLVPWCA